MGIFNSRKKFLRTVVRSRLNIRKMDYSGTVVKPNSIIPKADSVGTLISTLRKFMEKEANVEKHIKPPVKEVVTVSLKDFIWAAAAPCSW